MYKCNKTRKNEKVADICVNNLFEFDAHYQIVKIRLLVSKLNRLLCQYIVLIVCTLLRRAFFAVSLLHVGLL